MRVLCNNLRFSYIYVTTAVLAINMSEYTFMCMSVCGEVGEVVGCMGEERGGFVCVGREGGNSFFFIVGYLLNRCLGENSSLNTV